MPSARGSRRKSAQSPPLCGRAPFEVPTRSPFSRPRLCLPRPSRKARWVHLKTSILRPTSQRHSRFGQTTFCRSRCDPTTTIRSRCDPTRFARSSSARTSSHPTRFDPATIRPTRWCRPSYWMPSSPHPTRCRRCPARPGAGAARPRPARIPWRAAMTRYLRIEAIVVPSWQPWRLRPRGPGGG